MGGHQSRGKVTRVRKMSNDDSISNKISVTAASTFSARTPNPDKGPHRKNMSQNPFNRSFTLGQSQPFCVKGRNSDPGPEKVKLDLPKISTCIMMIPKPSKNVIVEELEEYELEDEKIFKELMGPNN